MARLGKLCWTFLTVVELIFIGAGDFDIAGKQGKLLGGKRNSIAVISLLGHWQTLA